MAANKTRPTAKEIAAALRVRVLQLTPKEIGFHDTAECPSVWGVVVETAFPGAVASLVALDDGSVSLYVSDGNGCVGCGSEGEVRWAAADLLQIADKKLPLTESTSDFSLPAEGQVRCYMLTRTGLRSLQVPLADLGKIDDPLGVLYFAGQRVVAAIERVGAGQSLAQEIRLAFDSIYSGAADAKDPNQGGHDQPCSGALGAEQCLSVGNVVRRLRT